MLCPEGRQPGALILATTFVLLSSRLPPWLWSASHGGWAKRCVHVVLVCVHEVGVATYQREHGHHLQQRYDTILVALCSALHVTQARTACGCNIFHTGVSALSSRSQDVRYVQLQNPGSSKSPFSCL